MPGILITNGGPHPPEEWAVATAEAILPMNDDLVGGRRIAALKLQAEFAQALVDPHRNVQHAERGHLRENAEARYDAEHDPGEHLDDALARIVAASKGTPWEEHFGKPDVQEAVRARICDHMATAQNVERQWHADRHPSEAGAAFKARFHSPAPTPAPEA